MEYKVKFVIFQGVVTALFPRVPADNRGNILSYAHIGQHGAASPTLTRYKRATPRNMLTYWQSLKEFTKTKATRSQSSKTEKRSPVP